MPQLIAVTTAQHYTDEQRAALKADIEQQMAGSDISVLILPPGAQVQTVWVPAPIASALAKEARPTTESPAGKPVEHVEAEAPADAVSFVWLRGPECSADQKLFAIGTDETSGRKLFAIPVDQCTPEQLAGRKVESLP
jgi:hypothetical protein